MISVVVATFNASEQLPDFFECFSKIDKSEYQLIIIDGASTDDTCKIINLNSSLVDHFISERDNGIYDAWNKGLKFVQSDWVLFLGADDRIISGQGFKNSVAELIHLDTDCCVAFTEVTVSEPNTRKELFKLGHESLDFYQSRFLSELLFPHTGTFHRVGRVLEVGGFDKSYKVAGDYDLLLRMVNSDVSRIKKIPFSFVTMAFGGVSTNRSTRHLAYKESILARKKNKITSFQILTKSSNISRF